MKVGVTGSRGVLGGRIARRLERSGCEVLAFDGDIRIPDEVEQWAENLDRIVHCAAVVPVVRIKSDPHLAADTNVLGTLNVAALAERTRDRHITYISSSHVYRESTRAISEDDALEPVSLYGLTKLQGEQWVQALAPRHLIVRVFSFFACDQSEDFLVPSLANRIGAAESRASIELANADAIRDIADADWIADACSHLSLSGRSGAVNCGTGLASTVGDIAQRLARSMGREDIQWRPDQLDPNRKEGLVANTSRMTEMLGELPDFDFDTALSKFVAERLGDVHV